ncbi:hypothetical protein ABQE46_12905 [Mycobacteroides chelonae]
MSDPSIDAAQRAWTAEGWGGECVVCFDSEGRGIPWPCETAKRVYPSEELGL